MAFPCEEKYWKPATSRVVTFQKDHQNQPQVQRVLGGSSHLVSGLVHPSYKWDFCRLIHINHWGYNSLTIRG